MPHTGTTGQATGREVKKMKRYAIIKRGMEKDVAHILNRPHDAQAVTGESMYYVSLKELITLYSIGAVLEEGK